MISIQWMYFHKGAHSNVVDLTITGTGDKFTLHTVCCYEHCSARHGEGCVDNIDSYVM